MSHKNVLAVDFGASSGRVMLGNFDGNRLSIQEIHRFPNDPVILNGTMYWDFLRLFYEVKQGLMKAKKYGKIDSIGLDTWGVDFGLIDKEGNLLENRYTTGMRGPKGCLKRVLERWIRTAFIRLRAVNLWRLTRYSSFWLCWKSGPGFWRELPDFC